MLCMAVLSAFDIEQLDHDFIICLVLVAMWMVFRWDCSEYSRPDHSRHVCAQVSVGPYPRVGFAGSWGVNVHPYMVFDNHAQTSLPAPRDDVLGFLHSGCCRNASPVAGMPTEKVPTPTAGLLVPHKAQGSRSEKEVALNLTPLKCSPMTAPW